MKKELVIVFEPSSYGDFAYRMDVVKKRIEKRNSDIKVTCVKISDEKLYQKIEQCLEKGGYVLSQNGSGIDCTNFAGDYLYKGFGPQIGVYVTNNPAWMKKKFSRLSWVGKIWVVDESFKAVLEEETGHTAEFLPYPTPPQRRGMAFEKRKNAILFSGTYLSAADGKKNYLEQIPEALLPVMEKALNRIEKDGQLSLKTVFREELKKEGLPVTNPLLEELVKQYSGCINEYLNRKLREDIICYLVKNGIKVAVTGANWEILKEKLSESITDNLQVLSSFMNLPAILQTASEYKIFLDCASGYQKGCHERVMLGYQAGCHVLTLENEYTLGLANNNSRIHTYSDKKKASMKHMITRIFTGQITENEKNLPEELSEFYFEDALTEVGFHADRRNLKNN